MNKLSTDLQKKNIYLYSGEKKMCNIGDIYQNEKEEKRKNNNDTRQNDRE